mgnify:CR=1 FL=1
MKDAIVLLSGGLDSATVLMIAKDKGYAVHALSFDYGQRHSVELDSAKEIARKTDVKSHRIIRLDMRSIGGSALTDDIEVPKDQETEGIPVTYVPARNTVFLSYALGLGEVMGTGDIFIGVNALDYSGYPDCRPEFIAAYERMANLATKESVEGKVRIKIHAPLMHLTKSEIIEKGISLGVDYALTSSCYDPSQNGDPCGSCDSCFLRNEGFRKMGMIDPRLQNK